MMGGLEPSGFQKFMYRLHSWFVPIFSTVWTIAMIKLWDWNVEGTGTWFAIAMIALGVITFSASIVHTFGLWDKFRDWLQKRKRA